MLLRSSRLQITVGPRFGAARSMLIRVRAARRVSERGIAGNTRVLPVQAFRDEEAVRTVDQPPQAAAALPTFPADADRAQFQLHWSVDMWRDFNPRSWLDGVADESRPLPDRLRNFLDTMTNAVGSSGVLGSAQSARYWAYHTARSGFFAAQAVLGLAAARSAAGRSDSPSEAVSRLAGTLRNGWQGPVAEAMLVYYQDYENIKEGRYSLPWDMTTPTHRQFNPLFILRRGAAFMTEAAGTMLRRERGEPDDIWLRSSSLPGYFQSGFHYQSDGWLSQDSAKVYESSTETLFLGRQDGMQRSTLVPLAEFMAGKDASQIRALEVAAGTGRFATFIKDNYPALDLTVSDLSPFYLAEARANLKYWKSQRAADAALPGVDRNGVSFLQTAAEAIAAPDASFDVVYCVYLFHELPPETRRAAAAEFARVLKPGGLLVLTDSMQLGDRPVFNETMGNFGDFNEPYYRSYIGEDFGKMFTELGLKCGMKVMASTTKTLSFRKPAPVEAPSSAAATAAAALEDAGPPAGDPNLN